MYIRTLEGLGKAKMKECIYGTPQRFCKMESPIKFRIKFEDFLREAEGAFERWMPPARAKMFVKRRKAMLKAWHRKNADLLVPDNKNIVMHWEMWQRRQNGKWRLFDVAVPEFIGRTKTSMLLELLRKSPEKCP